MCGCMLMHAAMNHEEQHHPASPSAPAPTVNVSSASRVRPCSHCSFPLQQSFAFCPNCGLPAPVAQAQVSLRMTECTACGQKVDPSWKACAHCGAPHSEAQVA